MEDFEEYLVSKKIDGNSFRSKEPELYNELKSLFDKVSPESFTALKLFLINPIRRRHQLVATEVSTKDQPTKKVKPKIQPRIRK